MAETIKMIIEGEIRRNTVLCLLPVGEIVSVIKIHAYTPYGKNILILVTMYNSAADVLKTYQQGPL